MIPYTPPQATPPTRRRVHPAHAPETPARPPTPGGPGGPGASIGSRVKRALRGVVPAYGSGDDFVWAESDFRNVKWSISLLGFLVYVFVVTTYQLGIADLGMIVALCGLIVLPHSLRVPPFLLGIGALYLWGWVTYSTSYYPAVVYEELITLGKLFLIMLVAVNVLRSRAEIRLYLILFSLFYAAYPARGTIFNYLAGYTHFGRALWNFIYANSNDLAVITLLALSIAAGILVTERQKWFRIGAFAAVILLTVIILLTKSRGVFLGLGIFAVFGLLPHMKRARSLGMVAVILTGIFLLTPSDVFERMSGLTRSTNVENLAEVDPERSAEQRYAIWQVSFELIRNYPVTGVGWGAYPKAHAEYSPIVDATGLSRGERDTHSTYFNVAAETGLPGLMIFLALVFGTLIHAERARRRCRGNMPRAAQQLYFLQLGLVGFLVAGIFASYSRISFLYLHLAIMYAVAQACNDDMERQRQLSRPVFHGAR
jgi:probable O-glycosylation ligase (exosortase A-associated)